MSVETVELLIKLVDHGILIAEIDRVLSPITTERLSRKLTQSNIIRTSARYYPGGKDYLMIRVNIKKGIEKPTEELNKGDFAYDPASDSLIISLKDGKTKMKVNKLGTITRGLEKIDTVERGCGVLLKLKK